MFEAANTFRDMLAAAGGYIGARVADIEDVRDRIVAAVLGVPMPGIPDPGHPFILVARDLAPADTATVDPEKVLGFVTTEGGPTSHTAILARTLGVPAVVAAEGALSVAEGTTRRARRRRGHARRRAERRRGPGRREADGGPARREATCGAARAPPSDGRRILLLANVGDPKSAQAGADAGRGGRGPVPHRVPVPRLREGADGRRAGGGLRAASSRPSRTARRSWCGRSTPARTSRWPSSTRARSPTPRSACGASGWRSRSRGSWTASCRPSRRAAERSSSDVWVMAPMIALASEAEWFSAKVREHGLKTAGVMVEVPAAALNAEQILGVDRVRQHRDERPRPVHAGGRPDGRPARRAQRPVAAGPAQARRVHRRGGGEARQDGGCVRRGRVGPGARGGAGRARRHQPVDVVAGDRGGRRAAAHRVVRRLQAAGPGRARRRRGAGCQGGRSAPSCPSSRTSACRERRHDRHTHAEPQPRPDGRDRRAAPRRGAPRHRRSGRPRGQGRQRLPGAGRRATSPPSRCCLPAARRAPSSPRCSLRSACRRCRCRSPARCAATSPSPSRTAPPPSSTRPVRSSAPDEAAARRADRGRPGGPGELGGRRGQPAARARCRLLRPARAPPCATSDTQVCIDASGPPLAAAVDAGPDLIKPNAEELAELVGRPLHPARGRRRRGRRDPQARCGDRAGQPRR